MVLHLQMGGFATQQSTFKDPIPSWLWGSTDGRHDPPGTRLPESHRWTEQPVGLPNHLEREVKKRRRAQKTGGEHVLFDVCLGMLGTLV